MQMKRGLNSVFLTILGFWEIISARFRTEGKWEMCICLFLHIIKLWRLIVLEAVDKLVEEMSAKGWNIKSNTLNVISKTDCWDRRRYATGGSGRAVSKKAPLVLQSIALSVSSGIHEWVCIKECFALHSVPHDSPDSQNHRMVMLWLAWLATVHQAAVPSIWVGRDPKIPTPQSSYSPAVSRERGP